MTTTPTKADFMADTDLAKSLGTMIAFTWYFEASAVSNLAVEKIVMKGLKNQVAERAFAIRLPFVHQLELT